MLFRGCFTICHWGLMRGFFLASLIVLVSALTIGGIWLSRYVAGLPNPSPKAIGQIDRNEYGVISCKDVEKRLRYAMLLLPHVYRDRDYGLEAMIRGVDPRTCQLEGETEFLTHPLKAEWWIEINRVTPETRSRFVALHDNALWEVEALPKAPPGRDLLEAFGLNPDPRGQRLGLGWVRDMVRVWRATDADVGLKEFLRCVYPLSSDRNAILFVVPAHGWTETNPPKPSEFGRKLIGASLRCSDGDRFRRAIDDVYRRAF
jgi:hypothetical protein